jgi:uncharacterized cupredoxin-like copper-binding protein
MEGIHHDRTMSRRALLKNTGLAALGGLAATIVPNKKVFAHEDHLSEPDTEIHVGDFYFEVHKIEGNEVHGEQNGHVHLHAGTHLIMFENEGSVQHEIHFGREVEFNDDGAAVGYHENLFHHFLGLHLNPGESGMLHVHIPEDAVGEWEIGCFIPGHYEAGQAAVLEIEAEEEEEHHDE